VFFLAKRTESAKLTQIRRMKRSTDSVSKGRLMATFSISDPLPYFRETPNVGLQTANTVSTGGQDKIKAMLTPGPVADTLRFPTGVRFNATASSVTYMSKNQGMQTRNLLTLEYTPSGKDEGARYLPWEPNKCSYMALDEKAKFAVTGPLSGCNIFVAGSRRKPMLFHTNCNDTGGIDADNLKKRRWVLDVINHAGAVKQTRALRDASTGEDEGPGVVLASLERQQYALQGLAGHGSFGPAGQTRSESEMCFRERAPSWDS
jgi:hypothetical protein